MKTHTLAAAFAAAIAVSGCTYQANVAPTATAAAEILPDRRFDRPVSYYISRELASLQRDACEGYVCSAHRFPIAVGQAVVSSIRSVKEAAFTKVVPGGTMTEPAPGAERHLVFQLESFAPRLHFEIGWWSATAITNAELALRVIAYDGTNHEMLRVMVAGNGYGEVDGGCPSGAQALENGDQSSHQTDDGELCESCGQRRATRLVERASGAGLDPMRCGCRVERDMATASHRASSTDVVARS